MPRKKRELTDNGIYHIFNRGNNRRDLFRSERDFKVFLKLVYVFKEMHHLKIYHYCLMSNHFHLLVKIHLSQSLPAFMHQLQLAYARYFKKRFNFIGHVFQARFRSPRIPKESYYLQCGRYIERNPVTAKLVSHPSDYSWSSARFYTHGKRDPVIDPDVYYRDFGNTLEQRKIRYYEFLTMDDPYTEMIDKELLGS